LHYPGVAPESVAETAKSGTGIPLLARASARRQAHASGRFLKCRENNPCGLTKTRENHKVHMYVNIF